MKDAYPSFLELASHNKQGYDYQIKILDRGSAVTIIAPHAGGIEPGASEIARAVAGDDYNYYLFEGLRADSNRDLHLTSTRFDEPQCLALIRRSSLVLAIHGCDDDNVEARVGGLHYSLRDRLVEMIHQAGFHASPGLGDLSGSLATNLCNMGHSNQGVQIEFTTGLRRLLFQDLSCRPGRRKQTPAFHSLIKSIRACLVELFNDPGKPQNRLMGLY